MAPDRPPRLAAKRVRRVFSLGLLAGATVVSVGSSSQASATRCPTDALRLVAQPGQGAAGTEFVPLRFELRRPGHCTLGGYPGVTLLTGSHPLHVRVGRRPTGLARTVHLDTRHPAYFSLVYHNLGPPGGRLCHGRVTGVRIIPPNDRHALTVTLRPGLSLVCLQSVAVEPVGPRRSR